MSQTDSGWRLTWRADPRLAALADRHYSRKSPGASQFTPPGSVVCLISGTGDAGWVSWRTDYPDADWLRDAWCCTLFRNEGPMLSSALITAAVSATRALWGEPPVGGSVTTVDARKVRRKRDPGRCFIRAGYRPIGHTLDRGLVILHLAVEDHPTGRAARPCAAKADRGMTLSGTSDSRATAPSLRRWTLTSADEPTVPIQVVGDLDRGESVEVMPVAGRDEEIDHLRGCVARAEQAWAASEEDLAQLREAVEGLLAAAAAGGCREDLSTGGKCWAPAEFLLWGRLLSPDALGPRCYDHAARHVGHRALGDPSWAIVDLRPLRRALEGDR